MIRGLFLLLVMIIIGLAVVGVASIMKAAVVLGCCLLCVASLMLGAGIMWYVMMSEIALDVDFDIEKEEV